MGRWRLDPETGRPIAPEEDEDFEEVIEDDEEEEEEDEEEEDVTVPLTISVFVLISTLLYVYYNIGTGSHILYT